MERDRMNGERMNQNKMIRDKIDIHVDDYAVSENASNEIISLIRLKKINSISVIPNMHCFGECMEKLRGVLLETPFHKIGISVHLNFMEGKPCEKPDKVPDLIDSKGFFKTTWGSLLLASYNPFRYKKIKNQLKLEIKLQMKKVMSEIPEGFGLRIDSHQHTHVIPVVFDAIKEAIQEEGLIIEYLRVPCEPIVPYLRHPSLYRTYSLLNGIKNILLNLYGRKLQTFCRRQQYSVTIMWGVVMSGNMDLNRVQRLLNTFYQYAEQREKKLEILFHAGSVLKEEITTEFTQKGFVEFHNSENRMREKETVMNLKY